MGMYRIVIEAVGGHGCKREIKDGQRNYGCGQMTCPDCQARSFVSQLGRTGSTVEKAILTHWPEQPSEVSDDLITGIRKGSF